MSLVEQALKKLQAARGAVGAPASARAPAPRTASSGRQVPSNVPIPERPARIVTVNRDALRIAGVLPPLQEERRIAQQYRQIKRPLVDNALGRGVPQLPNGHLIMLASALPGDGKTFTSVNLALSLALEKDVNILLVDADVPKPHISRIFGVESEPGLLDVLRDEQLDPESVVLSTDVPNLTILPAGRASETATELLASARMGDVVHRLGSVDPNRIVLFDSPPLLLTTESRALASVVGQVVLVVSAGSTPQKAVFDALELLGEGKSIGLVLNGCDDLQRAEYYNYYGQTDIKEGT